MVRVRVGVRARVRQGRRAMRPWWKYGNRYRYRYENVFRWRRGSSWEEVRTQTQVQAWGRGEGTTRGVGTDSCRSGSI